MADVLIYHPESGGRAVVPEQSVQHYRRGGWLTWPEHADNEVRKAQLEAEAAKAMEQPESPKPVIKAAAGKPASGEAKE
jgi:hypothetical protein